MQTTSAAAQRGMQANAAKLAEAQLRTSDLKKNARLSDNPAAAADSMAVRNAQAAADQYGRNIADGNNWLSMADDALSTSKTLLDRVQFLTIQGSNASTNAQGKEAIAVEIDSIRKDLMNQANAKYMGRNLFAGNSDAKNAFEDQPLPAPPALPPTPAAPPIFNGDGSAVQRRIGTDTQLQVDADGAKIFGDGANSIFGLLSKISSDLRNGGDVASNIDTLSTAVDKVVTGRSEVGARHAELLRAQDANTNAVVDLENQRSGIEDLDLGKAILDLQTQQLAYQTSLGVTAKVIQPTLMDFLR